MLYIDIQDVAEVQVVMSSDEELHTIYLAAKRNFLSSGACIHFSPGPHKLIVQMDPLFPALPPPLIFPVPHLNQLTSLTTPPSPPPPQQ